MIAKCIRRCWDGKIARRYYPGDQDDIAPDSPIAKYFEFPKVEEAKSEEGPSGDGRARGKASKGAE